MQAIVMVVALLVVLVLGTVAAGGLDAVLQNAQSIPGYFSLTSVATPQVDANGVQQAVAGVPQFGAAGAVSYTHLDVYKRQPLACKLRASARPICA